MKNTIKSFCAICFSILATISIPTVGYPRSESTRSESTRSESTRSESQEGPQGLDVYADQTEIIITSPATEQQRFTVYANNIQQDYCSSYLEKSVNPPLNRAICYFKNPQQVSQSTGTVQLKIVDQNGTQTNKKVKINPSKIYPINNLIEVKTPSYKLKMDKSTGTIYEYYYKDTDLNLIHSHIGAGLQIAFHQGRPNTFKSCARNWGRLL